MIETSPEGIDISDAHKGRVYTFSPSGEPKLFVAYEVLTDGSVACDEGYEAVIRDGRIAEFREVATV